MCCQHCVKAVKASVGAVAGVETVDVSLEKKLVTVGYDPGEDEPCSASRPRSRTRGTPSPEHAATPDRARRRRRAEDRRRGRARTSAGRASGRSRRSRAAPRRCAAFDQERPAPGDPRPDAARHLRRRGLPPAAGTLPRADHHADGEGGGRRRGARASGWGPTTTSPSPSARASSWPGSRPSCAGPRASPAPLGAACSRFGDDDLQIDEPPADGARSAAARGQPHAERVPPPAACWPPAPGASSAATS